MVPTTLRPSECKSMRIVELEEYTFLIGCTVKNNFHQNSNSSFPSRNNNDTNHIVLYIINHLNSSWIWPWSSSSALVVPFPSLFSLWFLISSPIFSHYLVCSISTKYTSIQLLLKLLLAILYGLLHLLESNQNSTLFFYSITPQLDPWFDLSPWCFWNLSYNSTLDHRYRYRFKKILIEFWQTRILLW